MVTSRGQLAAKGLDVVLASRQLGHANPNVTLEACAHLCARADHAASARDALEESYAGMAVTSQMATSR